MADGLRAVLVTYDARIDRFDSRTDRNRFYRGLYGYKQTVRRNDTVYEYEKPGLLGETAHIKVDDSVFIVARSAYPPFKQYFQQWQGKVELETFQIIVTDDTAKKVLGEH